MNQKCILNVEKQEVPVSLSHWKIYGCFFDSFNIHEEKYHLFSRIKERLLEERKGSWGRLTMPDSLLVATALDSRYFASTSYHTICQPRRIRSITFALCLVEMSGSTVLNYGFAPIILSSWHFGQA